jgi:Holin of 3TMs, for gene-transfer release
MDVGGKLIDKLIPDPAQRDAAKLELLKQQQSGELDEVKIQLSAIISDSQSQDKWTSRARPTFLYVVYILMLSSIPMGIVYAVSPHVAGDITIGFKAWLGAIPEAYLQLFGVVMTGYIAGRSWEKVKGAA